MIAAENRTVKIDIACLPVAGVHDPTQQLMMQGLNSGKELHAFNGIDDRFFGIIRTALKFRPDYIHFDWIEGYYFRRNTIFTILNIPWFIMQVLICRYILRIKIVWSLHNLLPHDRRNLRLKKFTQRLFARFTLFIRVFSPDSLAQAARSLNISTKHFAIVPSGAYTEYYPDVSDRQTALEYLSLPGDKKIFLFLGSIKPYKNLHGLIKAFQQLEEPDKFLVIAGKSYDDKYFKSIAAIVDENVRIYERFIEIDEMQHFYHAANVVVLPFNDIENSGSLLVAMGFRKVIIAPKLGVIRYMLKLQEELLYEDNKILQSLQLFVNMRDSRIMEIELSNYQFLKNHSWQDFADVF